MEHVLWHTNQSRDSGSSSSCTLTSLDLALHEFFFEMIQCATHTKRAMQQEKLLARVIPTENTRFSGASPWNVTSTRWECLRWCPLWYQRSGRRPPNQMVSC